MSLWPRAAALAPRAPSLLPRLARRRLPVSRRSLASPGFVPGGRRSVFVPGRGVEVEADPAQIWFQAWPTEQWFRAKPDFVPGRPNPARLGLVPGRSERGLRVCLVGFLQTNFQRNSYQRKPFMERNRKIPTKRFRDSKTELETLEILFCMRIRITFFL